MIFITGGIYQGKRRFAEEKLMQCPGNRHITKVSIMDAGRIISGSDGDMEDFKNAWLITEFQQYVRRRMLAHVSLAELRAQTEKLLQANPDVIITMSETGSGIVPIEKKDRDWREAAGRISIQLAGQAAEAYRVMAGIGIQLKPNRGIWTNKKES